MPEQSAFASRTILLPGVLQIEGLAPCFGTIASLSEQGLAFDFQGSQLPPQSVGQAAQLDFDFQEQHHSCKGLVVHIQDRRVLLSLRGASTNVLAALPSAKHGRGPSLAARLSVLQTQQACHSQFMRHMGTVVNEFYRLLPELAQARLNQPDGFKDPSELVRLQNALNQQRPRLFRLLTQAYPMYPELRASPLSAARTGPDDPIDMGKVDDWILRTTIAQKFDESLGSLLDEFNRHYNALLSSEGKKVNHPFQLDALLDLLADLFESFNPSLEGRGFCYELMGQAFQKNGVSLYQDLLETLGDTPNETFVHVEQGTSLEQWLSQAVARSAAGHDAEHPTSDVTNSARLSELTLLLNQLTENLGELNKRIPATDHEEAPGFQARDRIFSRFLPAAAPDTADAISLLQGNLALLEHGTGSSAIGRALGGLTDLDAAALQGLYASMWQPPPIDPGPEKLPQSSQVRALLLQAQGLLLELSLNGLTYQARPDHPAWTLLNELDVLHQGADNKGQFLDPALHQAISLAMQWLLGQDNMDSALEQVNTLLLQVNAKLTAERRTRRFGHLERLGTLASGTNLVGSGWCIVRHDDDAIPYEVLGTHDGVWALLDRSATSLLEIPEPRFLEDLDHGLIEEAESFDKPFLERVANASLTASLNAVHTYTWQDPASGCLKRSALMDELERRLLHPVSQPPSYCALIEIPTMRPSLSSLPGDELAIIQKRTGDMLREAMESGEQCGRLSDVSFLMVFAPQDQNRLASRLTQLKQEMESLHEEWKMIGAVVPLVDDMAAPTPSNLLRRANQACAKVREQAGFDLSCLSHSSPVNQIDPLPFSSLYLRCQKIAPCIEGATSHYEILLGVNEDLVPSFTTQGFVVMAEQMGRIHDLDRWVLQSALEWMNDHPAMLDQLSGLSINLSGSSLTLADHVEEMVELLSRYAHLTNKVIFEVTETAAIENLGIAINSLRNLRKLGCRIALDDFGSGYSSYSYLRSLPLDYLKIDGTYIRNILNDKTDQALAASMVDVAHALGLKVIAEFVDSEATYTWLKEQGVDYVQGYWVHQPERLDTLALH